MYVFLALSKTPWFAALENLHNVLAARDVASVRRAYTALYASLSESATPDLASAAARDFLYLDSSLARAAMCSETSSREVPAGLLAGARADLGRLLSLLRRDWQRECEQMGESVPPLAELAPPLAPMLDLARLDAEEVLDRLLTHYARHGAGLLARYEAFRWTDKHLEGVAHPAQGGAQLVGLERPLEQLAQNTEAFLARQPAQHALLYGPRGSGKSTAVKRLLPRYAEDGLRLVELPAAHLSDLLNVIEPLRGRPHRYVLFVDDLSFAAEDAGYAPLKTLLEGSLTERPENVLVYATSNRRHLVSERFSDRPNPLNDPSNDDVHAWDTQHERLALADRFGLTLTFPSATQSRYLDIVRGLAAQRGLGADDLDARAVRFAEWGNGYSGRTAQQFVDALGAGLA